MSFILATYHVTGPAHEIEARAEAIALEQTVELPRAAVPDGELPAPVVGEVAAIRQLGESLHGVEVRLSAALVENRPSQLINVLFGNISLQESVTLVDAHFPEETLRGFPGPRHGMDGLRQLTGAQGRALTCTALKPVGLPTSALAERCRIFAQAGIDVIKDDHGLVDQAFAPFAQRVAACQRVVEEVNEARGSQVVYAPNLSGTPGDLFRQAELCRELGVAAVMVSPMLVGLPVFSELVADHLPMPVLAHPAFGGALRMDPAFQQGSLFRLLGADASIFANYGGRFSYSPETCRRMADNLRGPFGPHKPALPTPAGGMQVDRIDEIIDFYGTDVMLLIGGSLYMAGDQLYARSRAFVENVADRKRE